MGLYCYLCPNPFGRIGQESGMDLRLFMLTAAIIPQVGLGSLLIWLGMPSRSRARTYRAAKKTIRTIIDN